MFGVTFFVVGSIIVGTKKSYEEKTQPTYERFLTYGECDEMAADISAHLKEHDLLYDKYVIVGVESGVRNLKTGETNKTIISVILDGRLANTLDEAQALADGYYAAINLYLGDQQINAYDVALYIAGKYKFVNSVCTYIE